MPTAPDLDPSQRAAAGALILEGARLLFDHVDEIHYTQGPERWEGIDRHLLIRDGRFPAWADCSSLASWLLWNALCVDLGLDDVVNGEEWVDGDTGTMLPHGREVSLSDAEVGDLVIYGEAPPADHVVVVLGHHVALSHGSEDGPIQVAPGYRADVLSVRRYF